MRPKLKGDTFYAPSKEGVYLSNNSKYFTLKGKTVYKWIERLAPHLDGEHELEDIIGGLTPDKAHMVSRLVEVLLNEGFIKDLTSDLPHTLSPVEESNYASEIAFVDYFQNSAAHRFERFRERRVLVVGSGLTLKAAVRANLQAGTRRIGVIHDRGLVTNGHEHLGVAEKRDSRQEVTVRTVDGLRGEAIIEAEIEPYDIVIHASDAPMVDRAKTLNRLCAAKEKLFIQAVVVDDHAWLGPIVTPGCADGCWECAWRRLQANRVVPTEQASNYEFRDGNLSSVSDFLTAPTAAVVANQLSFELFKYVTEAGPLETKGRMVSIDLETLQSRDHRFLPHPLCASCKRIEHWANQDGPGSVEKLESVSEETFSKRATILFDDQLGLFSSLDEHDFRQVPLNVSEVAVSNPMLLPGDENRARAHGIGTDLSTARRRATRRACEIYAASMVDRSKLLKLSDDIQDAPFFGEFDDRSGSRQASGAQEYVLAHELGTGRVRPVPARLVFPTLRGETPSREVAPGVASGFDRAEAISNALVSQCKRLTVSGIESGRFAFPHVDLAATRLDGEGDRYGRMLDILGGDLAIYDVTGTLRVPTFAFCLDGKTVSYGSCLAASNALRSGLEKTVLYCQARASGQPRYAPAEVPQLPIVRRGSELVVPADSDAPSYAEALGRLRDALKSHGWRALVVPLDHEPAFADVLPHIVNVVLERI